MSIETDGDQVAGDLAVPEPAKGLVIFAHGSGSSRHSPRNRQVAAELEAAGLATLLFDLLTLDEEREDRETARWRFDIGLLTRRLVQVVDWASRHAALRALPIGLFGASTGAAAALAAAAQRPGLVRAVASRGGRPDLADEWLGDVRAPALLVVGGDDHQVFRLNSQAARALARCRLVTVPGATHLFEEPGALEQVAQLVRDFFVEHLGEEARPPDEALHTP